MTAATGIYFIVARRAPRAVVFRRGPTRQVELLTWDLKTDLVTPGQWLKGRIYERRCDLSPSGQLLVYFAAKYETTLRTWTAISRPPYLTALALWPKGDAWGGGGLFEDEDRLLLNHRDGDTEPAEDQGPPRSLRVRPFGERPGWGEDEPIHEARLERDGWRQTGPSPKQVIHKSGAPLWVEFRPPIAYERAIGTPGAGFRLQMQIHGINERDGRWYVTTFDVRRDGTVLRDLGRAQWADSAPDGDLLLAQDGRLLRLPIEDEAALAFVDPRVIADLNDDQFQPVEPPPEMRRWPQPPENPS